VIKVKRKYKLGLIYLVMVTIIVTTIIVTVSLSLNESETFPWQITGREVVVGQQPAPKGETTYSQINDENVAWSNTLSNIPLDSECYCRLNITQGGYVGDVTIDWTLESSTDQGGTWTETGFSMTTQTTLSGEMGQIVYASADGTITGNHNWGQHYTASAWYRLRVVINVPPVGLFKSGYETGDLTEWDGKWVWRGSISAGPFQPHQGTYSCKAETTGAWGAAMAFKRLPAGQQLIYVRVYVLFETLPDVYNMYPIYIRNLETNKQFVGVFARNVAGKIIWIINYGNGGSWNYKNSAKGPSLGAWHCLEVMAKRGSGDGEVRLFVDGEELLSAIGLDNTMFGPDINGVLVGLGEGPGIIVVDCVEISTAPIGPE